MAGPWRSRAVPPPSPRVTHVLDGDTARLTVTGELTEAARRPLVRVLTELLLQHEHALARVVLDVRDVSFMNSAGMAVLVQLQRMAVPARASRWPCSTRRRACSGRCSSAASGGASRCSTPPTTLVSLPPRRATPPSLARSGC